MKERTNSSNSLSVVDAMTVEFEFVANPKSDDILCGKDKRCIKHEGSRDFRRIIESYTLQYQQATSRQEKMDITKQIFDRLQSRRFLKFNEDTDMWETLHPLAVRDKIGHALRFSNRKGGSTIRNKVRRNGSNPDICSSYDSSNSISDHLIRASTTGNLMSFGHSALTKKMNFNAHAAATSGQQNAQWGLPAANNNAHHRLAQNNIAAASSLQQNEDWLTAIEKLHLNSPPSSNHGESVRKSIPNLPLSGNLVATTPIMESKDDDDNDLTWMLQMPLMEMKPDGKVYFT